MIVVIDGTAPQPDRPYLKWTRLPLTRIRLPLAWWMSGHRRSLQLMIGNWDRRNFDDIQRDPNDDFVGISVGDNPYTGAPLSEAQIEKLVRSPVNWRELVDHGSRVGAVPRRLRTDTVVTLLYHGYVMAWCALTAPDVFDDAETQELLSFDAFQSEWALHRG